MANPISRCDWTWMIFRVVLVAVAFSAGAVMVRQPDSKTAPDAPTVVVCNIDGVSAAALESRNGSIKLSCASKNMVVVEQPPLRTSLLRTLLSWRKETP